MFKYKYKVSDKKVNFYYGIYPVECGVVFSAPYLIWIFTCFARGRRINARETTTLNINLRSAQRNYFALLQIFISICRQKVRRVKIEMSVGDGSSQLLKLRGSGKGEMWWGRIVGKYLHIGRAQNTRYLRRPQASLDLRYFRNLSTCLFSRRLMFLCRIIDGANFTFPK